MKPRWWIVSVLRDTRMSMDARGLLCFLGTQPAGWRYSVDECLRYMQWGRQKFQKILREAKGSGYLEASHKRDRTGRIKWTTLTLKDAPIRRAEKQPSGKAARKDDLKASGPEAENHPRLLTDLYPSENAPVETFRVIQGGRRAATAGFAENRRAAK